MRFRAPASIELRRAQILLVLAALVPTSLATIAAILILALADGQAAVVLGLLCIVFGVLAITGAVFVQVFLRRGDSLARMQNDFVSTVSHELRTPLTSIRMFVETLALGRVQGAEAQQCLEMLAKEVARLDGLVERVLELARLEAGKRAFVRTPIAVGEVVDGAVAAFEAVRRASAGPEVTITRDVAEGLVIDVDRAALEQALLNLLTNAYKYTGEDKRIAIRAVAHGRRVEIAVADNGPGIPKDEQKVIFDRFERGRDPAAQVLPGAGMGLAVVSLIVRAHQGKVDVSSVPGEGATFRLTLPRAAS